MFFGKLNAFQSVAEVKNPIYAEYKPNVPNPGKMEENMIHDSRAI
jgi:hypothetical protein